MISRRRFVAQASAAALYTATNNSPARATPLGLPLAIQLYSVRDQLKNDYEGTLLQVAQAGFREVESAGYFGKTAAEVKQTLQKAGLRCVSAHHSHADLRQKFDELLAFDKEIGVDYFICSSPTFKEPLPPGTPANSRAMTIDDWRWNAEQFNQMAEKTAAVGIRFGYHNHVHEFEPIDGTIPYMELLRIMDPAKTTLELDCGWAMVAGVKPQDLMRDHPNRFSMLHIKDFKDLAAGLKGAKVTELGMGNIDYRPIFQQAKKTQKIRHAFVEQEAFDMPWLDSLKVDANYMRSLNV
jgi:sugar phosphate isomerase/epimerase